MKISAILFLVVLVSGCASSPSSKSRRDEKPQQTQNEILKEAQEANLPDSREYLAIDRLYRQKAYDEVIERVKNFAKKYPKSEYLDLIHNLWGLALIGQKQYSSSIVHLKRCVELTQRPLVRNMTLFNVAFVHYELGQVDNALTYLDQIDPRALDDADKTKFHILRAKTARASQNYSLAAEEILSAMELMPVEAIDRDPTLRVFLADTVDDISNAVFIDNLIRKFEQLPVVDELLSQGASLALASGDKNKAKEYYSRIITNFPSSSHFVSARDMIKKLEMQSFVDPNRIGVVLTLSGKFAQYGYQALQGIQLALGIYQKDPAKRRNLTLVVIDDQGSVAKATSAMDELFYKHQVSAVIGPLVSKLAEPMGRKAQELGVPLIALSQKPATGGSYVFNAALTPEMQVHEIVDYAVNKAGIKRFAILAPSSRFGEEYTKAFWEELERIRNAGNDEITVRGIEQYPNDETDFRKYVDSIVGLSAMDARNLEVEELKVLKAATPVKVRSKKFDRMFDLKPIVDFEAVFIPDEPKVLGQILPTFAYRDVEKMKFLGINTWNSSELLARASGFAEGAVFVDGFHKGSQKGLSQVFLQEYRDTYNQEPGLLDALAFDAANILVHTMSSKAIRSRDELRDRIEGLSGFQGISGKISYLNGRLTKQLHLLTVQNGKIEEIAAQ